MGTKKGALGTDTFSLDRRTVILCAIFLAGSFLRNQCQETNNHNHEGAIVAITVLNYGTTVAQRYLSPRIPLTLSRASVILEDKTSDHNF